jgi:hypothetical protein
MEKLTSDQLKIKGMKMKKVSSLILFSIIVFMTCTALADEPSYVPVITGPWQELLKIKPTSDSQNDHCVYKDPAGDWHLAGISSRFMLYLITERYFAHGVTSSLDTPMRQLDDLLKGEPDRGLKWAPHAIWEGDTLHMYAGPGTMRHLVSNDGYNFEYAGAAIDNHWKWLRDAMVIKLDDGSFLMYTTDKDDTISAWTSKDLYKWDYAGVVFSAIKPAPAWKPLHTSSCESPFVIKMDDGYYLSVCVTNYPKNPSPDTYLNTLIFYSKDPLNFGTYSAGSKGETAKLVTRLETHAAEYILDDAGNWHITCTGWHLYPSPKGCGKGMVCIAPLEFRKQ